MAQFNPEPMWVQQRDQSGRIYWRHRITMENTWDNPMLAAQQGYGIPPPPFGAVIGRPAQTGLPYGAHPNFVANQPVAQPVRVDQPPGLGNGVNPNVMQPVVDIPLSLAVVDAAWEEHFDKKEKKKYWYNTIMNESTWKDPKDMTNNTPPPPPPPPTPTPPSPPPELKKREQDLWFKVDDGKGGKMWINEETGETEHGGVPKCRVKYKIMP